MSKLEVVHLPVASLHPYSRNARTHSQKQITQIAASIRTFGFNNPVLIDKDGVIIAGHGRVAAAKSLGLESVPVIRLEHMSEAQKRAYILADNKLAEKAGWDADILAIELQNLMELDLDFDISITGFEMPEIDVLISMTRGGGSAEPSNAPAPGQGTMTALMMPATAANDPMDTRPTPRARMSYVKACLPDYALAELKTRALRERVCINHILLKALDLYGIAIRPEDMIEDGRRLRGRNGVLP